MGDAVQLLTLLIAVASFLLMVVATFRKQTPMVRLTACKTVKAICVAVGIIAILAGAGQLSGATPLFHWGGNVGMALNTAICLLALALCIGWLADIIEKQ